jgi:sugar transferase (PEP-CTERM/EpsH1 system associated)
MKELLFLAHRIPYPPTKGDKIRSYHVLKHLTRDYRVHLGTFIDDAEDWRHVPVVQALCGESCFVRLRPLAGRLRSLAAFARGEPLTLPYYRSTRLQSWVDALLVRGAVRRVFVFSSSMAQYVERATDPSIRRVLDFVDMDSDKWRQYAPTRPWPLSWVFAREATTLLQYERRCAGRFDASVFVSEAEARLFRAQVPESAARVSCIENGVDTEYFSPAREYPNPYGSAERVIVFTGAMDYWANVDAVSWLAVFYIVGSRPGSTVRALAGDGVRVTGTVPDVRPYLAHAHVAVAPLRIARGVQNKVLEAMAMGRPVLASSQAADGLRLDASLRAIVCTDAADMAARALELLREGDMRTLGDRGREWVSRHYSWSANLNQIGQLLEGETSSARATPSAGGG